MTVSNSIMITGSRDVDRETAPHSCLSNTFRLFCLKVEPGCWAVLVGSTNGRWSGC